MSKSCETFGEDGSTVGEAGGSDVVGQLLTGRAEGAPAAAVSLLIYFMCVLLIMMMSLWFPLVVG